MVMTKVKYDETPLRLRISDLASFWQHDDQQYNRLQQELTNNPAAVGEYKYVKIFKVNWTLGFLVVEPAAARSKRRWVTVECPAQLLALERNTAECQVAVLRRIEAAVPDLSAFRSMFPLRVRLPVIDRFSANSRGERFLRQRNSCNDGSRDISTIFACDVHRVATSMSRGFDIQEDSVSGLVNIGLALESAGSTESLRQALQQIFLDELEIVYDSVPKGDVLRHRVAVYDAFLQIPITDDRSKHFSWKVRKRRFILSYFANSDLSGDAITHFCEFSCCSSPQETMRRFQTDVVWALIPHKMPVLSRKSWTGAKEATAWAGLLACHWGLLTKLLVKVVGKAQYPLGPAESEHHHVGVQLPSLLATWLNLTVSVTGLLRHCINQIMYASN